MKRIIASFLIFLCGISLYSQVLTQTVRGRVVDSQTEAPLAGAVVVIRNTSPLLGTRTDSGGNFSIDKVPVGRQIIEASHIGYLPYARENIFVTSNRLTELIIRLEESVVSLGEVQITRKIRKDESINQNAPVSARTFSIEETERYSGSIGDPARMASSFAGITALADQRNDIVIRGNSPLGVLWRLDGIDIPNPNHFASFGASGGPISMLNNNLLTNSDFFTSAFPAEYGNALSGVFDLKMRYGSNQKYEFVTQVGMNGFELGAEGPIVKNNSSFLINYRYSTLAIVDAMGFKVGIDAIPFYQDASFKISSGNTKAGSFSLIGIGGYSYVNEFDSRKDPAQLNNGRGKDFTFGSGMGMLGLIHKYLFSNKINIENKISASYTVSHISEDRFTITPAESWPYYLQKSDEKGVEISTLIKYKPDPKNIFQAGAGLQMLFYEFTDSVKKGSDFTVNIDQKGNYDLLKSHIQWQHRFTDNIILYGGLHGMFFTFNNKFSIEPRIGFKYSRFSGHSINFGFGLHSQLMPRMFYVVEDELHPGEIDPLNKKLGFSRSMHFVFGYNYRISDNLRLKTESYFQYLYQIPVKRGEPAYSMLNFGDRYFDQLPIIDSLENKGTGKNYGIEITLEKFLTRGYYALLTVSMYDSKYRGYDGIERNTAFNGKFVVNALAGKEFMIGKKNFLSLNFKITWAGGLRYVPYQITETGTGNYMQVFDWRRAYEQKRNDYFRINGRVGYKLIRKKFSAELAVDLMNMTNHKDIFTEEFNSSTGEMEYTYQFSFMPIGILRFQF